MPAGAADGDGVAGKPPGVLSQVLAPIGGALSTWMAEPELLQERDSRSRIRLCTPDLDVDDHGER
ncbi:hypothetical protein AB0H60_09695 [Nocardia rhamnosiphila]|uniref:hypothetical protein n=1 Tax=Nocardia rhamnosiphila TaxID=426716 RepID=UPI0033E66E27